MFSKIKSFGSQRQLGTANQNQPLPGSDRSGETNQKEYPDLWIPYYLSTLLYQGPIPGVNGEFKCHRGGHYEDNY